MSRFEKCVIDPEQQELWQAPDGARTVSLLIGEEACGAKEICAGLWRLAPGNQSAPDVHPGEAEIYYVVCGEGKLLLEDEEYTVREGMTVYIPAGVRHQSFNDGPEDLCYYYAFSPPPPGPPKQEDQGWNKLR